MIAALPREAHRGIPTRKRLSASRASTCHPVRDMGFGALTPHSPTKPGVLPGACRIRVRMRQLPFRCASTNPSRHSDPDSDSEADSEALMALVPPLDATPEEAKAALAPVRHSFSVAVHACGNAFAVGAIVRVAHNFLAREIIIVGDEPHYAKASMGMEKYETTVKVPDDDAFFARARKAGVGAREGARTEESVCRSEISKGRDFAARRSRSRNRDERMGPREIRGTERLTHGNPRSRERPRNPSIPRVYGVQIPAYDRAFRCEQKGVPRPATADATKRATLRR